MLWPMLVHLHFQVDFDPLRIVLKSIFLDYSDGMRSTLRLIANRMKLAHLFICEGQKEIFIYIIIFFLITLPPPIPKPQLFNRSSSSVKHADDERNVSRHLTPIGPKALSLKFISTMWQPLVIRP